MALRLIPVQGVGRDPFAPQDVDQLVRAVLRAREDRRLAGRLRLEDCGKGATLLQLVDRDDHVLDPVRGLRRLPISTEAWPFMARRASASTSTEIVAENSIVWRSSGSAFRMRRTSGAKPMSSIRSASSSTSTSTFEKSTCPRSM